MRLLVGRRSYSQLGGLAIVDLLFLRPGNEDAAKALGLLRSIISETDGEVCIAVAYFSHQLLVDEVIQRKKQGRVTHLLLNSADFLRPSSAKETEVVMAQPVIDLLNAADQTLLEVRTLGQASGKYQNMHHKFVVTDSAAAFGSVNWTKSALAQNYELLAISRDAGLISQFRLEFEALWNVAQEMYTTEGRLRRIMCPICREDSGVDFESYGPLCTLCGHRFRVVSS
jgi:phosphatidylserine/phosphatidylglycerophosphate/cardiolipin synthase-like enzyme